MKKLLVGLLVFGSLSVIASSSVSESFEANKIAIKEMLHEMVQDSKKEIGKPLDALSTQLGNRIEEKKYIQAAKVYISEKDFIRSLPLIKEKGTQILCNHMFWGDVIRIYEYEAIYEYFGASENKRLGSYSVTAADCKQLDIRQLPKVVDGCSKAVISINRSSKELAKLGKKKILHVAKQCGEFVPRIFEDLKPGARRAMLKDPNRFGCGLGVKFMLGILLDEAKSEAVKSDEAKMDLLTTRYCY